MFEFEYKNETELSSTFLLLTPGPCTFKIQKAIVDDEHGRPLRTKDGRYSLLQLEMAVTDRENGKSLVKEFVPSNASWKIKSILDAVGKSSWYGPLGKLDPQALVGLKGKGELARRTFVKRDGTNGEANEIKKYICATGVVDDFKEDEDLPF